MTLTRPVRTGDRQDTAARLLDSAARSSFDPGGIEIDWDAPIPPDKYGMSPEWSSLYGTDLWDRMTEDQRITLTRHEAASIAGTGIWFEMILMQMLVRDLYRHDPATPYVQFGLTEIADECRHSTMFARSAQHFGGSPPPIGRHAGFANPDVLSKRSPPAHSRSAGHCSPKRSSTRCSATSCATSASSRSPGP